MISNVPTLPGLTNTPHPPHSALQTPSAAGGNNNNNNNASSRHGTPKVPQPLTARNFGNTVSSFDNSRPTGTASPAAYSSSEHAMMGGDFNVDSCPHTSRLRTYDPLQDQHLGHYFSHRGVQKRLMHACLVRSDGCVLPQRNLSSKMAIIQQEFRRAETLERRRLQQDHMEIKRAEAERNERERMQNIRRRVAARREVERQRREEFKVVSDEFSPSRNLLKVTDVEMDWGMRGSVPRTSVTAAQSKRPSTTQHMPAPPGKDPTSSRTLAPVPSMRRWR
eukprot:PhM_4_TR2974/c0_g2_i1/m.3945